MRNKGIIASGLAALMTVSLLCPMAEAAKPVVDEAYYGVLDYYGALQEGSVVKSYYTNGNTILHDIGTYDSVENLTDRTKPIVSGENVTFDFGDEAPRNFYFQGKTTKPYRDMPFSVSLSYKMNGVETDAEDMAGQVGMAEITLDVLPNKAASEYQRNNFVLEAMTVLEDTETLSVEAEGGQVQKIGNSDVVLYAVLPGEERHFTLRVGTEKFSFAGFTFLVQPATLAQLDIVSDLRKAKGEVEDSYHAIKDSLNEILTSVEGMDQKLRNTASGLDQLNDARETLSAGKQQAYDEADALLESLAGLSESLAPVAEHLKTAKTAVRETTEKATALRDGVSALQPELISLEKSMSSMQKDVENFRKLLDKEKTDGKAISNALNDLDRDLDNLASDLSTVGSRTGTLGTVLNDLGDDGIVSELNMNDVVITRQGRSFTVSDLQTLHSKAEFVAAQSPTPLNDEQEFVTFAVSALGIDVETAKLLAYVYFNWNTGEDINGMIQTCSSVVDRANDSIEEVNDGISDVAYPSAGLLNSVNGLLSGMDGADGLVNHTRDLLSAAQAAVDAAISYDYDSELDNTKELLNTTETLLSRTNEVVDQGTALVDTVTKYEPDLQTGLEDAVTQINAVIHTLDDMNRFSTTMENLVKSADPDLDQGTEKSLTGLSDSLVQMANGLKSTTSIRKANEKVEKLVEDKWKEYTGEKNNALNMDSKAEMVSLTSEKNQSPNTLQIVLRTQEIKVPEDKKAGSASDTVEKTSFWQRVGQMFKDIAGIFKG